MTKPDSVSRWNGTACYLSTGLHTANLELVTLDFRANLYLDCSKKHRYTYHCIWSLPGFTKTELIAFCYLSSSHDGRLLTFMLLCSVGLSYWLLRINKLFSWSAKIRKFDVIIWSCDDVKSWEGFFCENIVLKILKEFWVAPRVERSSFCSSTPLRMTKNKKARAERTAPNKKYVLAIINIFLSSFFNF